MANSINERDLLSGVSARFLDANCESLPGEILYRRSEDGKFERLLSQFHHRQTIEFCAALLTVPSFQAATPRLECLVHLAFANCKGNRKPTESDLSRWLNRNLIDTSAYQLEDPAEDVFIGNVCTNEGNYRIFQDTYPYNDKYLTTLLAGVSKFSQIVQPLHGTIQEVHALLWLSEQICERLALERGELSQSNFRSNLTVSRATQLILRAKSLTFSTSELSAAGFDVEMIDSFLMDASFISDSDGESISRNASPLRIRPLVRFGDEIFVALPNAIASVVRKYLCVKAEQFGITKVLTQWLSMNQCEELLDVFSCEKFDLRHKSNPSSIQLNIDSFYFEYERGHYVHLLVLHDSLSTSVLQSDYSDEIFLTDEASRLNAYVHECGKELEAVSGFENGTLLIVFGGVGRRRIVPLELPSDVWQIMSLDIPDLSLLLSLDSVEFHRLMKAHKQASWLKATGVHLENPNSSFGLYSFFAESDYRILPRDFPISKGSVLMLLGDHMAFRRQKLRRQSDMHVARNLNGNWVPVARYARNSFFKSHANSPLYVSPLDAKNGILAAVVESKSQIRWLIIQAEGSVARQNAYSIWSNFVHVFCTLVEALEPVTGSISPNILEIYIDVNAVQVVGGTEKQKNKISPFDISVRTYSPGSAHIILPPNFFEGFFRVDNLAERNVLAKLGDALAIASSTLGYPIDGNIVAKICDEVLPMGGGRLIHIFPANSDVDHLLNNTDEKPSYLDVVDTNFFRTALVAEYTGCESRKLVGKGQCKEFLNGIVEFTWQKIRIQLHRLDRLSILHEGVRSIEAIHAESAQWRSSAQAVIALHGADSVPTAFKRDQDRSHTSLVTRILLEMAICESPSNGGLRISPSEYQMLIALVSFLVEVAYDSDAINGGLTKPEVVVFPSGEYVLDRAYQQTVMRPFISNQFSDDYYDAANEYAGKVQRTPSSKVDIPKDKSPYTTEFTDAFETEYGLSPIDLLECCAELMDLAVERESSVVVTTVGEIRQRLIDNRHMNLVVCDAFVKNFCLHSRPRWDKTVSPFKFRDIAPWMFRRRLSIVARPVLINGNESNDAAIYGLGQLINSWNYTLTRTEVGRFPQDFFDSKKMRAYIGFVANKNGAAFEDKVATELRLAGWQATTRVMMTALGGTDEQGDIDVLAWDANGNVLTIECKWLQQARTVREVAEVLNNFAGEERDNLSKHLARVSWLKKNPDELYRKYSIKPGKLKLVDILVTDTAVPMMYVKDLPIPAKNVVTLRNLVARVTKL